MRGVTLTDAEKETLIVGANSRLISLVSVVEAIVDDRLKHAADDEHDRLISIGYRDTSSDFCCTLGCGSGACESCPCCCAGWCVTGRDGVPDGTDGIHVNASDLWDWLTVAAEHNPLAARLAKAWGVYLAAVNEARTISPTDLRDALKDIGPLGEVIARRQGDVR